MYKDNKHINIIKPENREHWEKIRQKGIGGTDVSAIVGLNPYKSPLDVYLEKTEQDDKEPETDTMRNGHYFELAVSEFFQNETDNRIIKLSIDDKILFDAENPVFRGTPDRRFQGREGKGVLECKSTACQINEIPKVWYIQLQWYLMLTGYKHGAIAYVSSYGGQNTFNYEMFDKNPELIEYLRQEADKFWRENVKAGVRPEPINADDIDKIFPNEEQGKVIKADDYILSEYERLVDLQKQKKEMEKEINKIKENLKLKIKDAEKIEAYGEPLITYKASKPTKKFDTSDFQKDYPELYNMYLKEKPGSRRFLVK